MISINNLERIKPYYEKIQRGEKELLSFFSYFEGLILTKREKKVISRLLIESIQFKSRNRFLIEAFSKKLKRKIYKNDIKFFFVSNCFFRGLPEKFDLVEEKNLLVKLLKKNKFKKFYEFLKEEYRELEKKLNKERLEKFLEINFSHPGWYIKQLLAGYNLEIAKKVLNYNNSKPFLLFKERNSNLSIEMFLEDFFTLNDSELEKFRENYVISSFTEFFLENFNSKKEEKILIFLDDKKINLLPLISEKLQGNIGTVVTSKGIKKYKKILREYNLENMYLKRKDEIKNQHFDKLLFFLNTSDCGNWRNKFYLKWIITPEKIRSKIDLNFENLKNLLKLVKLKEIYVISESILPMENERFILKIKKELRVKPLKNNLFENLSHKRNVGYTFLPSKFLKTSGGFISILKGK